MGRILRALRSGPARFVFFFTLLLLPWPGLGRAYARWVGALAGAVLGTSGSPVSLRFTLPAETTAAGNQWQLRVSGEDSTSGRFVETALDLRRGSYLASAVFTALALATPLRWSRRLALLLGGVASLQLLPLLPVVWMFSGKLPVRAFDLGVVARSSVEIAYHTLVAPPGMAYAVPGLLWLLLVWLFAPGCLRLPLKSDYLSSWHSL